MSDKAEIETIDWQLVRRRFAGSLETFLGWYLPAVVFIIPLLIVTYGWPAPVIRQLVFFVLVGLGWLLWLGRILLSNEPLVWQRSALGWGALAVALAALASSFTASDPAAVWGLRGSLADSSPLGWLGMLGLSLLVVQITRWYGPPRADQRFGKNLTEIPKFRNSVLLLMSYILSSSLLAVFVILWWIFKQELITPALGLFSSTALWFAVNTLVLAATSLLFSGRARIMALILIGLHIVVLFGYDFDLAWYVLAGGGALFSVGQLLLEKRLARVDFSLSFGLIIISIALLFAPIKSLSPKLGFDGNNIPVVPAGVVWPRYYQNILKSDPVFGVGLGQSTENFWSLAELVDMRQVRQFPVLGNSYLAILWEGGLALFGAFIFWMLCLARSLFGLKTQPNIVLITVLGLFGCLVSMVFLPINFMFLFSLGLLSGLLASVLGRGQKEIAASRGVRSFLVFGGALLAAFLTAVIILSIKEGQGRLDFLSSIKTDKTGTSVDLAQLNRAISKHPAVYGYRLGRIDFLIQALREAPEQADRYLALLQSDFDFLAQAKLTGREQWLLAGSAEQIGNILRQDKGKEWFIRARAFYDSSLASLPRNVIILTDAARFYRQYSADILKSNETADALYRQAHNLLDRAFSIDNTYEPSFMEQAELLSVEGKSEEALESLKPLAEQSATAAYEAGHLAFTAQKFKEAVAYFKKAIEQNPNHLQARYELIQTHLALADLKSARSELAALEERAPKDDAATRGLLKGLGELLK